MPIPNILKKADFEAQILKALYALDKNDVPSIREASRVFGVHHATLARRRLAGKSRTQCKEMNQILTNAEEKELVRWIGQYTKSGIFCTNTLLMQLAIRVRNARVMFASSNNINIPPPIPLDKINPKWIQRFKGRHQEIGARVMSNLEWERQKGASYEVIKRWFDAVESQLASHPYQPTDIWNMDESGFGIGQEVAGRVLIHLDKPARGRAVLSKQEWVTDIECINAAGESLPPLLIFKGEHVNSGWLNERTPDNWFLATSKNGWTSNDLGLDWLRRVFEPLTCEKAAGRRRLLIADGHGSHITSDFIAYCMQNTIDLLIMPPHCSHLLQPLDVGVFASFKLRHSYETRAISRLSPQRIQRVEWIELLANAREKAVTKENILAGWRGAGLYPACRMRVMRYLEPEPVPRTLALPRNNNNIENIDPSLEYSLLTSSPPEPVELQHSNRKFTQSLRTNVAVVSPVKRYAERMTKLCESQNATIAIMAKQLAEKDALLEKRKKMKTGKRVRLEGVMVYSTAEVLRVTREEEANAEARVKKKRKTQRKRVILVSSESDDEDDSFIILGSDAEAPATRTRSAIFSHVEV
jgi:hypothetical protein